MAANERLESLQKDMLWDEFVKYIRPTNEPTKPTRERGNFDWDPKKPKSVIQAALLDEDNCEITKRRYHTAERYALYLMALYFRVDNFVEAWRQFCSFNQKSTFYKDAISLAMKMLLSPDTVQPNTTQDADTESNETMSRHQAEIDFFNPRTLSEEERIKIEEMLKLIVDQRYRHPETSKRAIDLDGKSARMLITTERLFHERIVLKMCGANAPKLGIPVHRVTSYCWYGPTERYTRMTNLTEATADRSTCTDSEDDRPEKCLFQFEHRTECSAKDDNFREGKQYVPHERLGSRYVLDIGTYDSHYQQSIGLLILDTDQKSNNPEKEMALARLMIKYAKSGAAVSLAELQKETRQADAKSCEKFNQFCFLVMEVEPSQWHSAIYCNKRDWFLGMIVAQARCLLMIRDGFLKWEDVFLNKSRFRIYSTKEMRLPENRNAIRDRCAEVDRLYKTHRKVEVLDKERGLKDLAEVYGDL